MKYKKKIFSVENINVKKLTNKFSTPIYCYSYKALNKNIIDFKKNYRYIYKTCD